MTVNPEDAKTYKKACWEFAEKFRSSLKLTEQISSLNKNPFVGWKKCVTQLQTALSEAANALVYEDAASIQALVTRDISPKFRFGVGLVSTLQLASLSGEHRGIPVYRFMLGSEKMWQNYLTKVCKPGLSLNKIRSQLIQDVRLEHRYFGNKNATGALLSAPLPAGLTSEYPILFPYRRSENGIAKKKSNFGKKYPWALVAEKSFPIIYALVARDTHPLGFIQIHVDVPDAYSNHIYDGIEKTWLHIFDPKKSWVQSIAGLVATFSQYVVAPFLERITFLADHREHIKQIRRCFPLSFQNVIRLAGPAQNAFDVYATSKWRVEIAQIQSLFSQPAYSPAELVNNVIDALWNQDDRVKGHNFEGRSKAERLLFWNDEYREHMVHILKVFLLGERILHEAYAKIPSVRKVIDSTKVPKGVESALHAFEIEWMLAATIHDYSLPYELLPELHRSYWNKFVMPTDVSKLSMVDETNYSLEKTTLADRILRYHLVVSLWQLLHFEVQPKGTSQYQAYRKLSQLVNDEENRPILYPKYLNYFLEHNDHGIASALWFLHLAILNNDGKLRTRLSYKVSDKVSLKSTMAVARACYFHNLATRLKRVNNSSDEKEPYFSGKLFDSFNQEPLTHLLLLADFLQDEGRVEGGQRESVEHSPKWSKRPLGHVMDISASDGKTLQIKIKYSWVREASNGGPPDCVEFGKTGCAQKRRILCEHRKNLDTKHSNCAETNCVHRERIRSAYDLLSSRLVGFPVQLKVEHETVNWDVHNA